MPTPSTMMSAVVAALIAMGLSGCATLVDADPGPPLGRAAPARAPRSTAAAPAGPDHPSRTAWGVLTTLPVRGRAPMTGYSREAFGPAWLDANRNGCDERNDILTRDLRHSTEENCRVLTGTLTDPYTGKTIAYVYGDGSLVDIDHVVALGNAWVSGAWRWDVRRLAALATDPLNLLAVDASANRQKGDGDAATWLPPEKAYRCTYVARQVAVKAKFGLSVTAPERDAMARVLARCPDQALPADSGAPLEVDHHISDPATTATSQASPATPVTPGSGGGTVWYENCDAARAAGAAPVRRGDPGYDAHLDGDGDGSACE